MITSATMGCLSLTVLIQSAQLDQCAATLNLTADVSLRPPMESGKLVVTCTLVGTPRPKNGTETTPHSVVSFRKLQTPRGGASLLVCPAPWESACNVYCSCDLCAN